MDDKLYLVDISVINNETFNSFFELFMQQHAVGIVTSHPAAALPALWVQRCKYIFASDGHECYVSNKLRYKHVLGLSKEALSWIRSKNVQTTNKFGSVHVSCDPYSSAQLVREFNELFGEYYAEACTNGFSISTKGNPRIHIAALISSNYSIRFITSLRELGYANFDLAEAVMQRGRCFYASSESDIEQLLTVLSEE
jgi:hypothetical protein